MQSFKVNEDSNVCQLRVHEIRQDNHSMPEQQEVVANGDLQDTYFWHSDISYVLSVDSTDQKT